MWHVTLHLSQKKDVLFEVKKCVLLVLRPNLFLPENRPLLINTRRVLRKSDGPLTEIEHPSWIPYQLQDGSPYLISLSNQELTNVGYVTNPGSSNQELTDLGYVTNRGLDQSLSIFSLLVNAHSKLQGVKRRAEERAKTLAEQLVKKLAEPLGGQPTKQPVEQPTEQLSNYPTDVKKYMECVEEVVKEIFFVPHGPQKKASPTPQKKEVLLSTPGPSTQPQGGGGNKGRHRRRGRKDDGAVEKEHSNSDVEFEDSDYCSGENREDNESETVNGLTFSQMETVLQRVSDGAIPDQERVEAAMLMLGMGGELSLFCAALLPLRRRAPGPQGLLPLIEGCA